VSGDEEKSDWITLVVATGCQHDARGEVRTVLAPTADGSLELAALEGRGLHLLRQPRGYVLGCMQDRRVCLADNLFWLVPIQATGALVPELDVALEVLANDRGLGRGLENIADEVGGRVWIREKG